MNYQNKKVLVVGMARSGIAAAQLLCRQCQPCMRPVMHRYTVVLPVAVMQRNMKLSK